MGSKTQTSTSQQSTAPTNLAGLQSIFGQVQNAASTPFTPYTGELTAPVNAQQQTGISNVNAGANVAQPYYGTAANYATQGASPITAAAIQSYSNPFTQSVIDATQQQFNESNGQQQQQVKGSAALAGALGGDRQAVAQSETARQQQLAQAPVIAGLNQQNYQQALAAAQADRSAAGNAAGQFSGLGTAAQTAALQGAGAQINAGSLEQQTQQQADAAKLQQFQVQQAYPFQTAQFLAQNGIPAAVAQGSSTSGTQTAPGPNWLAQLAGVGIAGAGVASKFAGAADGGRIGFADGGSPFNFINDTRGYVPVGGGAPQATLQTPQLKYATPQQSDMKPITSALSGIGSGTFRNPFAATPDYGQTSNVKIGGYSMPMFGSTPADDFASGIQPMADGGLVGLIHGIHSAIKRSRGGSVGGSPFQGYASGGPAKFADGGSLDDRFGAVQEAIADGSFDPVGKNSTTFDPAPAPFRLDRSAAVAPQDDAPGIVPSPAPASPMRAALPPPIAAAQQDDSEPGGALAFDSTGQSPLTLSAPDAAPAEPPQAKSPFGISPKAGDALIATGLGIMASRSPFALSAIGEGGLTGLANYSAATTADHAAADKKITQDLNKRRVDLEAARHVQEIEKNRKDLALRTRAQDEKGQLTDYQKAQVEHQKKLEDPEYVAKIAKAKAVDKGQPEVISRVADGIKSGRQAPVLTGLYGQSGAVRAKLEQDGFDLGKAQLEWERAKKQISSLNGPQMVRFVGLAQSVDKTIDEVRELSEQLQNSGIPALNKLKLQSYMKTQGNSEHGQLAARYIGAVNTLKEEFANLAQGGYAPTEAVWHLANEQINGDYGVKQMGASLEEIQRLIRYRVQSMPGLSTSGPGSANRYTGQGGEGTATPAGAPAAPAGGLVEGRTGTDAQGRKVVVKDGKIVPVAQ